ncbi:hypothetical protein Acor_42670 [Acrocarpospora corrugata]|uniref:Uncharacterized protein n=1 Tax=Acrocarpospora corrugata TaxID=35763 RepID=A0A5M3W2F4_9ACTN|nr:hypothetical protein Acor_42670 [Acrocarpospora corrugata]
MARAADVVPDEVEAAGQEGDDLVPDAVGVGVAVQQEQGRAAPVALLDEREPDAAGFDPSHAAI